MESNGENPKSADEPLPEPTVRYFRAADGTQLAFREIGAGRPLLLIHGFFSNAMVNWVRYGHAQKIAARGFRLILPDLRGHGDSAKPHDPAAYPRDVLTDDAFALLKHLELVDYDLGGYSLGARTTIRMLIRGARPRRAVVAGLGVDGIVSTDGRGGYFRNVLTHLGTFTRGSAEWMTEAFLKTVGGDPVALLHILDTFVDTPREALAGIQTPTLAVIGSEDDDTGSAEELARLLSHGRSMVVPGNHMSAVTRPELGAVMADFFAG